MFDLLTKPAQAISFAECATLVLIAGLFCAPAGAASSAQITCNGQAQETLDVSAHRLVSELMSHGASTVSNSTAMILKAIAPDKHDTDNSLLAPQAEAAIRHIFSASTVDPIIDIDKEVEAPSDNDDRAEVDSGMSTRLPGISDDDFLRYKKQMYRQDI